MSLFDRRMTNWINRGLDSLLPAFVRDSGLFMGPLMRMGLGPRWREFVRFKEQAPTLSPAEIDAIYRRLASSHLPRDSDLHPACLARLLERAVGATLLDVGCGRGSLARQLAAVPHRQVVGLDIIPPVGEFPPAVSFCAGRAHALPFADRSFDTVICAHTLEHTTDPCAVVRELRRVTRRRLLVVVPRQRPYRHTFDLHLHFFPYPHTLALLLGATTDAVEVLGGDLYYEEDLP